MRLRWIALSAQTLCIVPGLAFDFLETRFLPSFIGTIATMAILNTITWRGIQQNSRFVTGRYTLLTQLCARHRRAFGAARPDRWALGNPLIPLLFVHAGIGALLLGRRQSSVLFALIISCLIVLQFFSQVPPALEKMEDPAEESLSCTGIGGSGLLDSHHMALVDARFSPRGLHSERGSTARASIGCGRWAPWRRVCRTSSRHR